MRLRYTKTALGQIEHILDYIDARSRQGAVTIRDRIQAAGSAIENHPEAGQATSRNGVRRFVLTPYPYVIFYRITATEIIVTRFRHTARKPPIAEPD